MVPAALGMGRPSPARLPVRAHTCVLQVVHQLVFVYLCAGGSLYHRLLSGNRRAGLLCVCIPKEISQEQPVNPANTDPSPRAFSWASKESKTKELLLGKTQELFVQVTRKRGKR